MSAVDAIGARAARPTAEPPAPATRRRRQLDWILRSGPPGRLEMLAVLGVLLAVAAALFGSHVVQGSFYYDDWANSAHTHEPGGNGGFGAALDYFWALTGYRPLLALYVPVLHEVLGEHWGLHLAWAATLAAGMSAAVYLVLAELRMARLHALLIATLVLIFPYSDVTWLWAQASSARLTGMLWLIGLWLALRGLNADRSARSARIHHIGSLAFYLSSICIYELPATLMLSGVLLYWLRAGLRAALRWWAVDVVLVGAALVWVVSQSGIDKAKGSSGMVDHARLILDQGLDIFAISAQPFGPTSTGVVLGVLLIVCGCAALVAWWLPAADPARGELRRWLAIFGAGVLVAFIAWAIFIPSDPYYTPVAEGLANRTNVLAAIGIVIALYAVFMLAGTLAFRGLAHGHVAAAGLAAVLSLVLAAGYADDIRADKEGWHRATVRQQQVLGVLKMRLSRPAARATIYTFNAPQFDVSGAPIFAASWDLNGAVKLLYDRPDVNGYPVSPGTTFQCAESGMGPVAPGVTDVPKVPPALYGRTYFADIGATSVERIDDRAGCRSAQARFTPGPVVAP